MNSQVKRLSKWVCGATVACALAVLSPATAEAQTTNEGVRLFVGYAFNSTDGGTLSGARLSPEWTARPWLRLVADGSWQKGSPNKAPITMLTFLGGPRLVRDLGSKRVYVHALAGGVRERTSLTVFGVNLAALAGSGGSSTRFGVDGGLGIEFNVAGMRTRIGGDVLSRRVPQGNGKNGNVTDIRATLGVLF